MSIKFKTYGLLLLFGSLINCKQVDEALIDAKWQKVDKATKSLLTYYAELIAYEKLLRAENSVLEDIQNKLTVGNSDPKLLKSVTISRNNYRRLINLVGRTETMITRTHSHALRNMQTLKDSIGKTQKAGQKIIDEAKQLN